VPAPEPEPEVEPEPEPSILEGHQDWGQLIDALLLETAPRYRGLLGASDPAEARRLRITQLEADIARLEVELSEVPQASEIEQIGRQRSSLFELASAAGPSAPVRLVIPDSEQLEQLLQALAKVRDWPLPAWSLGFDREANEGSAPVFADPELQQRLLSVVAWVDQTFAGAPPPELEGLPEPEGQAVVVVKLADAWMLDERFQEVLQGLPPEAWKPLRALPRRSALIVAEHVRGWLQVLNPEATKGMLERLVGSPKTFPLPPEPDRLHPGDTEILASIGKFPLVLRFLKTIGGRTSAPSSPSSAVHSPGRVVDFDHVVTDERGHIQAATLVVPKLRRRNTHIFVEVPIRIIADARLAEPAIVEVHSTLLSEFTRQTELPGGYTIEDRDGKPILLWTVAIRDDAWYQHEPGRFFRDEIVSVPLVPQNADKLRGGKEPLRLSLKCGEAESSRNFERILREVPSVPVGSGVGDKTDSELIRSQPMGVQVDHEKLEGIIGEGRHSFMVVAPRRFGKTTLYHHLAEVAKESGHEVVKVELRRDQDIREGVRAVWDGIRGTLERRYKSSPAFGASAPSEIWDAYAWENVRSFIKDRRPACRTLVVLVDEAQVLVPGIDGRRWGERFKPLVENVLSTPTKDQVLVQIVLVGTVDLSVRIGQNCRDALLMNGTQKHAFDEAQLARYLRTVGQGLIESSRDARARLAQWSNNLNSLTVVFGRIRRRLSNAERLFMLGDDVTSSIEDLLASDTEVESVWAYARSELSYSDDWEPVDSFPLAVAWACTPREDSEPLERLDRCTSWLNDALRRCGNMGTITSRRMQKCREDLGIRGVLKHDGTFNRPLLEELLRRRKDLLHTEPASTLCLFRLAVDAIEWPSDIQRRDGGGDATIYVAERGDKNLAYRTNPLNTEQDRSRFARTCAALRTLREHETYQTGDDFLPRIRKAGFRVDEPSTGIIVYDWVEGEAFDNHWDDLPELGRCHVVKQIAQAVEALHHRNVLHCDIAPRNIIVNSKLGATLIDFGLARPTSSTTGIWLEPERFKAPELCGTNPAPDKSSDIYALGSLLAGPGDGVALTLPELQALTERMLSKQPSERPDIKEVLRVLSEHVDIEPAYYQELRKAETIVDGGPSWLIGELTPSAESAALMAGGYVRWDLFRAMELSFLLNNIFARIVQEQRSPAAEDLASLVRSEELSLSSLESRIGKRPPKASLDKWKDKRVRAVGLLRNAWAHPTRREENITGARQKLGTTEKRQVRTFLDATAQIAVMLDELLPTNERCIERFVGLFHTGAGTVS